MSAIKISWCDEMRAFYTTGSDGWNAGLRPRQLVNSWATEAEAVLARKPGDASKSNFSECR
jgi:hypothetical protein